MESTNTTTLPLVLQNPAQVKNLAYTKKQVTRTWILWGGVSVLAIFGLAFPVESVVIAPGRVIPSDQVKVVQHLEGGIVNAVLVKEGEKVKQGQPLVEIDLGGNSLNLEELTVRNASLQATRARLLAESQGKTFTRASLSKDIDDSVFQAEAGAYEARMLEQRGVVDSAESQLAQTRSKLIEQQERVNALSARMSLYKKEVELSQQLLEEKLIPQLEVLEKQRQYESTRGDLATARQALVSAGSAITEAQGKVLEAQGRFRRRASDELATAERQLASITEDLSRAKLQRSRTVVRASADGVIKGLRNPAPGWVVKPGEQIMEVVPDKKQISIEAKLNPSDRGYVHTGQHARIKVTAYDFLRYGAIDGKVSIVGADADSDPSNPAARSYYRLLIATDKEFVGIPERQVTAGMEVEVDLLVGRDPFIWYMLRPVLKAQREAFQEP
ncbi:MAG TPA: HlyD family type I secretion periplasmic adaptor subunit [Burkholderiaceae bacterium]